ncbi:acyltransferase [Psychrosphaera haliotis]|nr:acyltransferase [Psychrosphaera haliotis]
MQKDKRTYYSHIDSLRAIAVFTVILFHINHSYLPGGFVGVDIFFVISGYLISSQLFKSVSNNTFSIKEFYARRIKRILPAALSVIIFTVVIAQFLYLPEDSVKVAESGIWSALSLPNVYFWKFQDTSYFAASSYTTPLLHYWSLGVEEQFYLFWPLIVLILLPRLNKVLFCAVILITILISAGIAQALIADHHSFVYYMLPTRAGELLVGAFLAALLHFNIIKKPTKNTPLLLLSVFGIVASCVFISSSDIFPGWLYLIPTSFAALFIWSGFNQTSLTHKFITIKPILWLGKVSYSAYLVHWPLLAFYRYGYGEPSIFVSIILFIAMLLLASMNWKFIEERFRYASGSFNNLAFKQFILPCIVLISLAFTVIKTDGLGLRMLSDTYVTELDIKRNHAVATNKYDYVCQYWRLKEEHFNNDDCIIGDNKDTDVLLWGDSNAAHYIGILGAIAKEQGWSFRNVSHAACPPIFSDVKSFVKVNRYDDCASSINLVRTKLAQYNTIVVSAAYSSYQKTNTDFMSAFESTLLELSKTTKHIVIIGKAPVFKNYDRHCLSKAIVYPLKHCLEVNLLDKQLIDTINDRLAAFSRKLVNVNYVDFNSLICENGCSPYKDGKPIYFDSSHLEAQSSWSLNPDSADLTFMNEGSDL